MKKIIEGNPRISYHYPAALKINGLPGEWVSLFDLALCLDHVVWSDFTALHHLAFPQIKTSHPSAKFTSYEKPVREAGTLYENESARMFLDRLNKRGHHQHVYAPYEWALLVAEAVLNKVIRVEILNNNRIRIHYVPDRENRLEDFSTLLLQNVRKCAHKGMPINLFTRIPKKKGYVGMYMTFTEPRGKVMFFYSEPKKA